MANYHFITHWKVKASCEEVYRFLEDVESLPFWWSKVYKQATVIKKEGVNGLGREVVFVTKGLLPYYLHWGLQVTSVNFPNGFSFQANGDFDGLGQWRFEQHGTYCHIVFDWCVTVNKPLIKHLTPLLKPIFELNHLWAMRQGENSIQHHFESIHAIKKGTSSGY
jgi:Polyketide cyclase / dehydrase and lipid transport